MIISFQFVRIVFTIQVLRFADIPVLHPSLGIKPYIIEKPRKEFDFGWEFGVPDAYNVWIVEMFSL